MQTKPDPYTTSRMPSEAVSLSHHQVEAGFHQVEATHYQIEAGQASASITKNIPTEENSEDIQVVHFGLVWNAENKIFF